MDLIVLGSSGTFPRPGGACSGYLIRHRETRILIDLGTGVLSRLQKWEDPTKISALFLTHLHPDHFLDIYPYRYYLQFTAKPESLPLKVFAPSLARDKIIPLYSDPNIAQFDRCFSFQDLREGSSVEVGSLKITPYEVPHLKPTYALLVESVEDNKKFFYTSDTGYEPKLVELARRVDLFLCEVTLTKEYGQEKVLHLTTALVGEIANEAGVKKLVLTHLWPHFSREQILAEVREVFQGEVELAEDEKVYEI